MYNLYIFNNTVLLVTILATCVSIFLFLFFFVLFFTLISLLDNEKSYNLHM